MKAVHVLIIALGALGVAEIGVVATVVGVVLTALKFLFDWRHGRSDSERRNETRRLADAAAGDLNRLEAKLRNALATINFEGISLFGSGGHGHSLVRSLKGVATEMDDRHAKLRVAFGPRSRIARSFGEALGAFNEVPATLAHTRLLRSDPPPHAREGVEWHLLRDREAIEKAREKFESARTRFEEAASKA